MVKYILQLVGWGCFVFGIWYVLRVVNNGDEQIKKIKKEEEDSEKEGARNWEGDWDRPHGKYF